MCDTDSDLPLELKEKYDIPVVQMPYIINGEEFYADLGKTYDLPAFYNKMRSGEVPVTASLSTPSYIEYFEPVLKEGKDILFIAFSHQLSSTIHNIFEAREELLAKYPGRWIEVVDTLTISLPETLLILKAHEMYRGGASIDEVVRWLEDNKLNAQVFITVDSLVYLKRGGRVSGVQAFMGTVLDLKPVLTINKEGKIVAIDKTKGRKKALRTIVANVKENISNAGEQEIIILHADCENEANNLKKLVLDEIPEAKTVSIYFIGEVIGAHAGPGTIGVAFMGKQRPH